MAIGENRPYTALDADQVLKQSFDEEHDRLRVDAEVTAIIDVLELDISAASGDNIAISDGVNNVTITQDGSKNALDVYVVNNGQQVEQTASYYDNISGIPANTLTTILNHILISDAKMQKIDVAGNNIAIYQVKVNGDIIDQRYTYFGSGLNAEFNFSEGIQLLSGDQIVIQVEHDRPDLGDFNARLQLKE